jgi:hypothetical protein
VTLIGDDSLIRLFGAGVIWAAVACAAAPWLLLYASQREGMMQRIRRRLPF